MANRQSNGLGSWQFPAQTLNPYKTLLKFPPSFNRQESNYKENKPDRATMRPGCVFACIDHMIYMERQMDEQMGEMT